MKQHGTSLNDESLVTLSFEVESIINSRPLTVENKRDMGSEAPLCPKNLLTMKTNVVLPPPGIFSRPDLYSHWRLRRVQHTANEFWNKRSFWLLCRTEANGTILEETSKLEILSYGKIAQHVIIGQWLKLSNHTKEAMVMFGQLKYKLVTALSIMGSYLRHWFVQYAKLRCWLKITWFNSPTERLLLAMIKMIHHLRGSHVLLVASHVNYEH